MPVATARSLSSWPPMHRCCRTSSAASPSGLRWRSVAWAASTANAGQVSEDDFSTVVAFPNNGLTTIFTATVQATEEAIVNAMVAAETVIGASGFRVEELPEEAVRAIFE